MFFDSIPEPLPRKPVSQKRYIGYMFCAATVASALLADTVHANEWRFSSGADYSTGDYGASKDTDILYLPFSASYLSGPWKARVTIPWIRIEGPGVVTGGGDGVVVIKPKKNPNAIPGPAPAPGSGGTTTESGLGDIWASLTYQVEAWPVEYGYLDVTGKIKFPTADEDDGLGTGETDYTLQADYAYPMDNKLTPMLAVAYKIKGDPDGIDLDNVFYISAGADYRLDSGVHVGASLDFQEASSDGADDALELFAYLSYRMSQNWTLMPYAYHGFTDGSPDYGIGTSINYRM